MGAVYGVDGYTACIDDNFATSKYFRTVDLGTTPTHVAMVIGGKTYYVFNRTGKVQITHPTFGVSGVYELDINKPAYCKVVKADTAASEATMLSASLTALKSNLSGTTVLTAEQINDQTSLITSALPALAYSQTLLAQAIDLVDTYDSKKGAIFVNDTTKGGFNNNLGTIDGFEMVRAVMTVQQGLFDKVFRQPAVYEKYKAILKGKSFPTHVYFPGAVKAKADPLITYNAIIKANFPAYAGGVAPRFSDYPQRKPTGYYLAAGDTATVVVPQALVGKGYSIIVGAHQNVKTGYPKVRRFFNISQSFAITKTSTEIYNPFGGGIYISVPLGANDGVVTANITNAVPAPFFSATAHATKTTNADWQKVQRNNPAPWADFESDTFMLNVPTAFISNYADPVALMADWDKRLSTYSFIFGQATKNFPSMYLQVETTIEYPGFLAAGYPGTSNIYYANDWLAPGRKDYGNADQWFLQPGPDSLLRLNSFFPNVEFHEFGHAQQVSMFDGEYESFVNLNFVAVLNRTYGTDIDLAFSRSLPAAPMTRAEAASDWMKTDTFRSGKPMILPDQASYQFRGHAKYVDIAALFGWDLFGTFYKAEADAILYKTPGDGFNTSDSRVLRFSKAASVDLRPMFHFWGIQPSAANATKLGTAIATAKLPQSRKVYDRLVAYKDNTDSNANAIDVINGILTLYFPTGRPASN